MRVEKIQWVDAASELLDADITVLLFMPCADEPVWPGYWDGEEYTLADGGKAHAVTAWAQWPAGPVAL